MARALVISLIALLAIAPSSFAYADAPVRTMVRNFHIGRLVATYDPNGNLISVVFQAGQFVGPSPVCEYLQ
jgi:hypothetical protein